MPVKLHASLSLGQQYAALVEYLGNRVKSLLTLDPDRGSPRALKLGIHTVRSDHNALVRLMLAKGVISSEEYQQHIVDGLSIEAKDMDHNISTTAKELGKAA